MMTPRIRLSVFFLLLTTATLSCVDPEDIVLRGTVDVIVVDGLLTDQNELQVIRLNRSRAEPNTGRFGTLPITGARVEVVVDSNQVVKLSEREKGSYVMPDGFRGQTGHSYQLRFVLDNGKQYVSSPEIMQPVPAIETVSQRFEPASIPATNPDRLLPANEFFLDTTDPASQTNYYRWDWMLWEKQDWCKSCYQGRYVVYDQQNRLINDCLADFTVPSHQDYQCQTQCWEILRSTSLNLFSDNLINGRPIRGKLVARIPYLDYSSCLVEIRQSSLSEGAYQFFRLIENQSQNAGGLADAAPTAPIGNVRNQADAQEPVVGYFVVSSVSRVRYWLNRTLSNQGAPLANTLFEALNARTPELDNRVKIQCIPGDDRTPFKPDGWRD